MSMVVLSLQDWSRVEWGLLAQRNLQQVQEPEYQPHWEERNIRSFPNSLVINDR